MKVTPTTKDVTWFVTIGASGSDGLNDIADLLSSFAPDLNAIVMVVLHRQFDRPSNLQKVLARATRMSVIIAKDDGNLERGNCYIGTPAVHLTLLSNTFSGLVDDPGKDYRNRTVDLLFKSVAQQAGCNTIGIVLSGALDDGSRGLAAIHHAGGKTMVLLRPPQQNAGMPENAISYDGPIDCIGSVDRIAQEVRQAVFPGGSRR